MGNKNNVAILVLSIGERQFNKITLNNIGEYAKKVGASLIVEKNTDLDFKTTLRCKIGQFRRNNIACYIQKMASIYNALNEFEKVLLLDDSCLVNSHADNLFDLVPEGYIAAYPESERSDLKAYSYDKDFLCKKRGVKIKNYYNTGVLLVDRHNKELFSPKCVYDNLDLFKSAYPSQAFFNYIVNSNVNIHQLSEQWNFMPIIDYSDKLNRQLKALPKKYVDSLHEKFIIHVTGYYEHRGDIIEQIGNAIK